MQPSFFDTKVLSGQITFKCRNFIKPMILSSGPIYDVTEAVAEVRVSVNGTEATGRGGIYLSDLWSWPHPTRTHEDRDEGMRVFATHAAGNLTDLCGGEPAHPLSLGLRLHQSLQDISSEDGPPLLSRLVCGSPFDAAIHDAVGNALGRSSFSLYEEAGEIPEADHFFKGGSAAEAIRKCLRTPLLQHDAWLIVSQNDNASDIAPWILKKGYHGFKLKLQGKDNEADVRRTIEVLRMVKELGCSAPRLAVDANCANPDSASVLDYLERLKAADIETFNTLEYLEQPTGRDIVQNPYDWREVTKLKPVILDEGLMSMEALQAAKDQGWSGIAIKTCRGHSFSLLSAAAAYENGMLLAMQDLTNPGIAAIHAALVASYLPVCNGMELNSPQYTPEANAQFLPRLSALLEPGDGLHTLPSDSIIGLGANL